MQVYLSTLTEVDYTQTLEKSNKVIQKIRKKVKQKER